MYTIFLRKPEKGKFYIEFGQSDELVCVSNQPVRLSKFISPHTKRSRRKIHGKEKVCRLQLWQVSD